YMVEAEELCDRVAIINAGRVLACDTPAALKRRLQRDAIFRLETTPLSESDVAAFAALGGMVTAVHRVKEGASVMDLRLEEERVLGSAIGMMEARGIRLANLTKREPT